MGLGVVWVCVMLCGSHSRGGVGKVVCLMLLPGANTAGSFDRVAADNTQMDGCPSLVVVWLKHPCRHRMISSLGDR